MNQDEERGTNDSLAITSLIFGIIGVLCSCLFICSIVGLVLSLVSKDKVSPNTEGIRTAGFVLSIVGLSLGVLMIILRFGMGMFTSFMMFKY